MILKIIFVGESKTWTGIKYCKIVTVHKLKIEIKALLVTVLEEQADQTLM